MKTAEHYTIAEAARRWALDIQVPDLQDEPAKWWSFKVLGLSIYCPNFKWRQQALAHHDLHHIVTGYPCTMAGEIQLATWEFAAGRFPNIYANLFCLPLVALGLFVTPRNMWAAFKSGRVCRSLFGTPITSDLLATSLIEARAMTARQTPASSKISDAIAFCGLVGLALLLTLGPVVAGAVLLANYTA